MTKYNRGDVVLVDFAFSEKAGSKRRPALIISSSSYQKKRMDLIIAAITSNVERVRFGDTKIDQWEEAGLIYPSLVTGIIRTIKCRMVIKRLGALPKPNFQKVQKNLRKAMGL